MSAYVKEPQVVEISRAYSYGVAHKHAAVFGCFLHEIINQMSMTEVSFYNCYGIGSDHVHCPKFALFSFFSIFFLWKHRFTASLLMYIGSVGVCRGVQKGHLHNTQPTAML